MSECEALNELGELWCHTPADRLFVLGCLHEHLVRLFLCPLHAVCALICQECWLAEGALAHRCALFMLVDKGENLATGLGSPNG